ncbi:TPA: hypothetical protein ACOTGW_002733 [Clostridium perfringens]|uniref:hypothetical protein n=1 Tax=Clostridium perfringens TaxID=1502 RepID=UPI0024BC6DAD|nr:hypothetical protein [Clostridium perfringens]
MGIYEDEYYTTKVIKVKENMVTKTKYVKDKKYKCDIQPITERAIKYTWGKDIKSKVEIYCNESILINDILVNDNKIYKVEDKKDWKEYKIYALLECDEVVIDG